MKTFQELATDIGTLVEEKNKAYGSAFDKAGDFMRILYPEGIKPEQYKDMLCTVRIFDKLMRIATSYEGTEEKKVEAYSDINGYSLLGLRASLEEQTVVKKSETKSEVADLSFKVDPDGAGVHSRIVKALEDPELIAIAEKNPEVWRLINPVTEAANFIQGSAYNQQKKEPCVHNPHSAINTTRWKEIITNEEKIRTAKEPEGTQRTNVPKGYLVKQKGSATRVSNSKVTLVSSMDY